MPRVKSLRFKGEFVERKDRDGNVVVSGYRQSFPGIPARDLDENDIRELSSEQYRDAIDSGLYVAPESRKTPEKAESTARTEAANARDGEGSRSE